MGDSRMTVHNILQFAEIAGAAEKSISEADADFRPRSITLLERFRSQFDVLPANTVERIRTAQRIRYQVYCIEHSHEKSDDPDGVEMDVFDSHATQSLLIHKN